MAFKVMWMRGPLSMGTEDFADLRAATDHAKDELSRMQTSFGATAVKVVDEAGKPHFLKAISRT